MTDLFDSPPDALPESRTRHGKIYTLRTVTVGKEERWAIKWRAEDGKAQGGLGGYYATPELAWADIDRHPEALAALRAAYLTRRTPIR